MRNNFQGNFEAMQHLDLDAAYGLAVKNREEYEIQPEDFSDLYTPEQVARDEGYVKGIEDKFKHNLKQNPEDATALKYAEIFEAIVFQHGEQSNWFGENAVTIRTSRYDDIVNGVDMVLEVQDEAKAAHLGFAIDVTYKNDLRDKIERIKSEIEKGELAKVKYFQSETADFRGEKSNIPRFVISAEMRTLRELTEAWVEGKNDLFAEHPIQFQILDEIIAQCDAFEAYANKCGKPELAAMYTSSKKLVEEILADRNSSVADTTIRDDALFNLKLFLSNLAK